jgi:hypothetical protein
MGRRRNRNDDRIGQIAPLVGVLMLLCLITPQLREIILGVGFIASCVLAVIVVGLFGFGIPVPGVRRLIELR